MTKDSAIEIVKMVKEKRSESPLTVTAMDETIRFIEALNDYDHNSVMRFLSSKESGKLGGDFMYLNKAIAWLKLELKKINKQKNT